MRNDEKIINLIDYLFNKITKTNNLQNLHTYNNSLNFFNKKLIKISEMFEDELALNIIDNNERLFTDTEIFNEFQIIKRDLFLKFLEKDFNMGTNSKLAYIISRMAEFYLRLMNLNKVVIKEEDKPLMKKVKAMTLLRNHIRHSDYAKAYEDLKYLNGEDTKDLLRRLDHKLKVNTNERFSIEILKNHLV